MSYHGFGEANSPNQQQSEVYLDYARKAEQCASDSSKCAEIAAWTGAEAMATAAGVDPAVVKAALSCAKQGDAEACIKTGVTAAATTACVAMTGGVAALACGPAAGFVVDLAWPVLRDLVTDPMNLIQSGLDTLGVSAKAKFDWYNVPDSVAPAFSEQYESMVAGLQNAWHQGRAKLGLPPKQFIWGWCDTPDTGCKVQNTGAIRGRAVGNTARWDRESKSEKEQGGDYWQFWGLLHDKTIEAWVGWWGEGFIAKDNPGPADSGRHWGVNPEEFPLGFTFKKEPTPSAESVRVSQQSLQTLYLTYTMDAVQEGFKRCLSLIAKLNAEEYSQRHQIVRAALKLPASKIASNSITAIIREANLATVTQRLKKAGPLRMTGTVTSLVTKPAPSGGVSRAGLAMLKGSRLSPVAISALQVPFYKKPAVQVAMAVGALAAVGLAIAALGRRKGA